MSEYHQTSAHSLGVAWPVEGPLRFSVALDLGLDSAAIWCGSNRRKVGSDGLGEASPHGRISAIESDQLPIITPSQLYVDVSLLSWGIELIV